MENLTELSFLNDTLFTNESNANFSVVSKSWRKASTKPDLYNISPHGVNLLYIAYASICTTALIGNLLVLWLILGSRRMWIVTNIFLVNLAIADIVISLFTIPFHFQAALLQRWDLPEFLCPICPFVEAVSVLVSVLTLCAIALNRYKVVMNPFVVKTSKRAAIFTIIMIWTASITISLPTYLDFSSSPLIRFFCSVIFFRNRVRTVTPYCHQTWFPPRYRFYYLQLLVLCQYFIPMIIMVYAYARMGFYIWKSETPGNEQPERDMMLQRRKRKITKMMAGIVLLFSVCWLPYQLYNLLLPYYPEINDYPYINVVWFSCHWLAMSNSSCNPFVYAIYNGNFRNEFRRRARCFGKFTFTCNCTRGNNQDDEVFELQARRIN